MNKNYSIKSSARINPTGGFNILGVDNPLNNYAFRKYQNYTNINNKNPKIIYLKNNRFPLEENKAGLRTNPKPLPNSFNLNPLNYVNEQKFNAYYDSNNYPQRIDNIKDLLNNSYHEERIPNFSLKTADLSGDDIYFKYNGTNNYNKKTEPIYSYIAQKSLRIPSINQKLLSSLVDNTYNKEINKEQEISYFQNPLQNFREINSQLCQSARFPLKMLYLNNTNTIQKHK